jgi:hypothetical protein
VYSNHSHIFARYNTLLTIHTTFSVQYLSDFYSEDNENPPGLGAINGIFAVGSTIRQEGTQPLGADSSLNGSLFLP